MTTRRRSQGFSLVEALIGLAILGIVMAAIIPAFMSYLRVNTQSDIKSGAVTAAESVLDNLRETSLDGWPASGSVLTTSGGDRQFQVTLIYCTSALPYCSGNARHLEVVARYQGKVYYDAQTVYTKLNTAFN